MESNNLMFESRRGTASGCRSRYQHSSSSLRDTHQPLKQQQQQHYKDEHSTCSTVVSFFSDSVSLARSDARHEEQPFDECERRTKALHRRRIEAAEAPFDETLEEPIIPVQRIEEEQDDFGDLRESPSDELPQNSLCATTIKTSSACPHLDYEINHFMEEEDDYLVDELGCMEDPVIPNPFAKGKNTKRVGQVTWPSSFQDLEESENLQVDQDETDNTEGTTIKRRPLHIDDDIRENEGKHEEKDTFSVVAPDNDHDGCLSTGNKVSSRSQIPEASLLTSNDLENSSDANVCPTRCIRQAKRTTWQFSGRDLNVIEPDEANESVRRSIAARETRRSRLSSTDMLGRRRKQQQLPQGTASFQRPAAFLVPFLFRALSQQQQNRLPDSSETTNAIMSKQPHSREEVLSEVVKFASLMIEQRKATDHESKDDHIIELEEEVKVIMDKELQGLFRAVNESLEIFSFPSDEAPPEASEGFFGDRLAEELAEPDHQGAMDLLRNGDSAVQDVIESASDLSRDNYIDAHYHDNLLLEDDDDMHEELAKLHWVEKKIESELSQVESVEEGVVSTAPVADLPVDEKHQKPDEKSTQETNPGVNNERQTQRGGQEVDNSAVSALIFPELESVPTDENQDQNGKATIVFPATGDELGVSRQVEGERILFIPSEVTMTASPSSATSEESDRSFDTIDRWRARISEIVEGGNLMPKEGDNDPCKYDPSDEMIMETVIGVPLMDGSEKHHHDRINLVQRGSEDTGISDPSDDKILEAVYGTPSSDESESKQDVDETSKSAKIKDEDKLILDPKDNMVTETAETIKSTGRKIEDKEISDPQDEMVMETVYVAPSLEMITEALFTLSEENTGASDDTETTAQNINAGREHDLVPTSQIISVSLSGEKAKVEQSPMEDKIIEQQCRYTTNKDSRSTLKEEKQNAPVVAQRKEHSGLLGIQPMKFQDQLSVSAAKNLVSADAEEMGATNLFAKDLRSSLLGIQPMKFYKAPKEEDVFFVSVDGKPVTSMLSPSAGSASAQASWEDDSVVSTGNLEDTRELVRQALRHMKHMKPVPTTNHTPSHQANIHQNRLVENKEAGEYHQDFPSLLSESTESRMDVPENCRGENYSSLLSASIASVPVVASARAVPKTPPAVATKLEKPKAKLVLGERNKRTAKAPPQKSGHLDLEALSKSLNQIRVQEKEDMETNENPTVTSMTVDMDENSPPVTELDLIDLSAVVVSDLELPPRKGFGLCDCAIGGAPSSGSSKGNSIQEVQYLNKIGKQKCDLPLLGLEEQSSDGLLSAPVWSLDPMLDEHNADSIVKALGLVLKTNLAEDEQNPESSSCLKDCVTPIATESFNAFSQAIFPKKSVREHQSLLLMSQGDMTDIRKERMLDATSPILMNDDSIRGAVEKNRPTFYPPPPSALYEHNSKRSVESLPVFLPPPPSAINGNAMIATTPLRIDDYYPYPPCKDNINDDWDTVDRERATGHSPGDMIEAMRSQSSDDHPPITTIVKKKKEIPRRMVSSTFTPRFVPPETTETFDEEQADLDFHFVSPQTSLLGPYDDLLKRQEDDISELTLVGDSTAAAAMDKKKARPKKTNGDWQVPSTAAALPLEQIRREGGGPIHKDDSVEALRREISWSNNKNDDELMIVSNAMPFPEASNEKQSSFWSLCQSDNDPIQVLGTMIRGCFDE